MPTQVPNSGYIEKVYFNTSLSNEQARDLLKELTYNITPFLAGVPISPLLFASDGNPVIFAQHLNGGYAIVVATDIVNQVFEYAFIYDEGNSQGTNGFEMSEYTVNKEVIAEYSGLSVGTENDKLTQLISITPFEEPIALKPFLEGIADAIREKKKTTELINAQNFRSEILSIKGGLIEVSELPEVGEEDVVYKLVKQGGVAIPTSGLVEKVYINTNYTEEEIKGIIEEYATIPLQEGMLAYPIAVDINTGSVLAMLYNDTGFYAIGVVSNDGLSWTLVTDKLLWGISLSTGEGVFDNEMLSLNWTTISEAEGIPIGSKNNELTNLISTTPSFGSNTEEYYIYDKVFKPFPNKGTISEIYFNTDLSVEEVVAELSKLTLDKDVYVLGASYESPCLLYITYNETAGWTIQDIFQHNYFFVSSYSSYVGFEGWNHNLIKDGKYTFDEPIKLLTYGDDGDIIGTENWKITNVVRIFEPTWKQISGGIKQVSELPTEGNSNYVYKIQSGNAELYMSMDGELINFADVAQAQGIPVSIEIVDKLPTENINASSETTAMYLYYIIGDTIYAYMDFGDGNLSWVNFIEITSGGSLTKPSGEYNSVDEIQIEEGIGFYTILPSSGDYYIYEGGKPTQVPNSGWIENLYFNTKLSVEEVDNILSQLTYDEDGYAYVVGAYEKDSGYGNIIIVEANAFTEGQIPSGYIIGHMNDITNMASTDFIYMSNQGLVDLALTMGINTKVGWNMETLNLNQTFNGAFGTENDKLINVISTTLYPRWTKISGGGATVKATPIAVPNTGYVERVYLNKSLTFDEVNAIVEKANSFVANELVPIYCVVSNDTFDKQLSTFKLTDHDGTTFNSIHYPNLGNVIWSERDYYNEEKDGSITQFKKGWMFEEDYVEINSEVVSFIEGDFAVNVGQHNDQLTELFSANGTFVSEMKLDGEYDGTTIFLSNKIVSEPTVVPNSGYVEKVYFNTSLSVEEVVAIINDVAIEMGGTLGYYVLSDANMLYTLSFSYNNNLGKEQWSIYATVNSQEPTLIWSEDGGWASENNVIEYNIDNVIETLLSQMGMNQPMQNEKLINLISITPFEVKTVNNFNIDIKSMLEEKKLPLAINVNIQPNLQEKEITENGEYVADEGYDGFSKVTVNVGGSSEDRLKKLLDARQSANYLFHGFQGKSVDYLISYSDTENVTDMNSMFSNCMVLQTIPQLDTSKAINMGYMFYNCYKLTAVSQLDTSKVTNAQNMFYNCNVLTEIPQLNTSKVTSMNDMFSNCYALETISQLDLIRISSDYNVRNFILNCKALTNLTLLNIKVYLTIGSGDGTGSWDWGHLLTLESLINTVKELINVGSARTLTMGTANLEKIANTYVKFTDTSQTTIPTNEKGDVVVCDSTDTGAMLLSDYALLKNWTLA